MTRAMYPGSFDPVHLGHVDVVEAAAALFSEVVVVAMFNREKSGFFELADRQRLLDETFAHLDNVRTHAAPGLVIDVATELDIDVVVKGVRGVGDLEIEMQMAQTNKAVTGIRTMFVPTEPEHAFVSSRFIREISAHGGDVSGFVPDPVAAALAQRSDQARSSS